uniref:NADH-ubiquinone oxidoreductase chain 2 n=1 Tax=Saxidomus purpurata TaxID=311201 RepID=A0A0D4CFL9_9BIVA|nr:NADH dehydrogenase subunit 2 [Saxidomus purpurata]AJT47987.1 NADH dehydrogenase subunit 2 [Saxidomus purpurata]
MFYGSYITSPKMYSLFYTVCSCAALMTMLSGTLFALVSAGVLGMWVGMEVNFLGAVCFMSGVYVEEGESVMKYLIVQVVGSCFLLLSFLMLVYHQFPFMVEVFIILGLCMKLGIFPFHFWVASVMSSLSWFSCFVVSVIQKVAPLWLLSNLMLSQSLVGGMEMLAVLTSLVGCLGGLGMLNYRALMGYSSLVHLGFLVILCLAGLNLFWSYLLIYGILNCGLMFGLWSLGIYCYSDLLQDGGYLDYIKLWWVSLYFFSLAGIPPFTGIFLKVYFLVNCWTFAPLGCILCFASSAVSMYFYFSVLMEMLIHWGKSVQMGWNWEWDSGVSSVVFSSVFINLIISYPVFLLSGM